MSNLGVHVKVRDFKRSEAFYHALGFKKVFEYGPGKEVDEDYNGVVFDVGGTTLEIANGHRAVDPNVFEEPFLSSKISLMVKIKSLSPVLEKCRKAKIPLAVRPRIYYWGTIEAVVKDPDGLVIVFICPYTKREAKRVEADKKYAQKPKGQLLQ